MVKRDLLVCLAFAPFVAVFSGEPDKDDEDDGDEKGDDDAEGCFGVCGHFECLLLWVDSGWKEEIGIEM